MQAFENFITAAKSGGGEGLNGGMAELGGLGTRTASPFTQFLPAPRELQQKKPIETRASLAFLLSDRGNFFREFLLDEVKLKNFDQLMTFLGPRNATPEVHLCIQHCSSLK